jgi:hypothetical protein
VVFNSEYRVSPPRLYPLFSLDTPLAPANPLPKPEPHANSIQPVTHHQPLVAHQQQPCVKPTANLALDERKIQFNNGTVAVAAFMPATRTLKR